MSEFVAFFCIVAMRKEEPVMILFGAGPFPLVRTRNESQPKEEPLVSCELLTTYFASEICTYLALNTKRNHRRGLEIIIWRCSFVPIHCSQIE